MADSKKKAAGARDGPKKKTTSTKARSRDAKSKQRRDAERGGPAPSSMVEVQSEAGAAKAPWCGTARTDYEETTSAWVPQVSLTGVTDPVRAPIDRAEPPDVFSLDKQVRDPRTDKVVIVLRRPLGFPSGSLPADPGAFRPRVEVGQGLCHVLAPIAALRCTSRGRYG